MPRKIQFTLRLTPDEKSRLEWYAKFKNVSMSELIQDFCKSLPEPPSLKEETPQQTERG
jgi:hypothetical protein